MPWSCEFVKVSTLSSWDIINISFSKLEQYPNITDIKLNTEKNMKHMLIANEYSAINVGYHRIRIEVFA